MNAKYYVNHSAKGDCVVITLRPDLLDSPTEITARNLLQLEPEIIAGLIALLKCDKSSLTSFGEDYP